MKPCEPTPIQELYRAAEASALPLNMMLELTYRCNESCLHCYLPETQGVRPARAGDELTASEWGRVLEELAEAGTLYLILSGGEVLLRSDFDEILRRARDLYFSVEVFTNATLVTPAIAERWAELGVTSVGISCYSPVAALHDRMTRLKGSFEATILGARLLKESGLDVKLKSPLMKLNFENYRGIAALAGELGVGYHFDPMLVPRNDGADAPIRLGLGDAQLRAAHLDTGLIPREDVLGAGPLDPAQPTCSAGRTSGAIGPFGDVVPCIQWMVKAGNVRERPFREIWEDGKVLQDARRYTAADLKPCPDCGRPHVIHCLGVSELQRKDPLIPSEDTCRLTRTIRSIQEEARVHGS